MQAAQWGDCAQVILSAHWAMSCHGAIMPPLHHEKKWVHYVSDLGIFRISNELNQLIYIMMKICHTNMGHDMYPCVQGWAK